MKDITVCIVDDISELRQALEEIVSSADGYKCLGTMSNAAEAIAKIPILNPDVVLMDINLGESESGIDCVRQLKPVVPATNFMMCTVYEDDEKIFEALSAGASGYILKKTEPQKLLEAIKELHGGGAPMSGQIARKVVVAFRNKALTPASSQGAAELEQLSYREKQILEELSRGLMYKEIANVLFISPETVKKHVYHVYEKLHVTNRVEAVNKYFGR
jgi:DNA-binding NarL/FixJ family response regulator